MILNKKPITLAEVQEIVADLEVQKEMKDYLKAFTKLNKEKAMKLAKEIADLNNPKLKEEDIVKIVDFLPRDSEEISVVLREVTLTEEETNAILSIVQKY